VSELRHDPVAASVPYSALFDATVPVAPVTDATVAELLRCSMGLSAWKQFRTSRWALRVNPSSGNLHPTETYVVRDAVVAHYAADDHALEQRARLRPDVWEAFAGGRVGFLVALTSIHWREAWKYGERAFRYCQHDTGHALAALRFAAALLGWRLTLLSHWSDAEIATLCGIDRAEDFVDAEPEEAECIAVVTPDDPAAWHGTPARSLAEDARTASWRGRANQLSPRRVDWPAIAAVASATRYPGRQTALGARDPGPATVNAVAGNGPSSGIGPDPADAARRAHEPRARAIVLQRRSALGFDARSSLPRETFLAMLRRLRPSAVDDGSAPRDRPTASASPAALNRQQRRDAAVPWDAIDWPPYVHLLVFVHRVDGLVPGLYAYLRDRVVGDEWRSAMRPEFLWEPVTLDEAGDLFLLVPTDVSWIANRLSCDQDIAADGFFSLAMIARVESVLRTHGQWFYRRLFWEAGMIGQTLYLEAEAAGARATGIGCFYDDPVHEMAGLSGHEWQSLYHFSMGIPVDDGRLTTEPGYPWETR
jgi:SagB-type dehydrogenase family enzyme